MRTATALLVLTLLAAPSLGEPLLIAAPLNVIKTLCPLMEEGVLMLPTECAYSVESFSNTENPTLYSVESLTKGVELARKLGLWKRELAVVCENCYEAMAWASSNGVPLLIAGRGKDERNLRPLLKELFPAKLYVAGIKLPGASNAAPIPSYSPSKHRRLVVGLKGDKLAELAAVYAGLTESRLAIVNSLTEVKDILRRKWASSIVYVISFDNLSKAGIDELYRPIIEAGGEKYLKAAVGIITGTSEACAWSLALRSYYYLEHQAAPSTSLLVYMEDGALLAEKIARVLLREKVKITRLVAEQNLTRTSMVDELKRSHGIVFINLHGNPWCMATRQVGPCLVTAHSIGPVSTRAIIVTLSCKTCDIEEVGLAESSIAVSFVSKGALAYIGARKLEYTGLLETSTAYSELIVQALADGLTVGEAVRQVNNLHISESKTNKPWLAAYTCLLGDPDITVTEKREPAYEAKLLDSKLRITVRRETCCILARINVTFGEKEVKLELRRPDLFVRTYYTRSPSGYVLNIFITRKISRELGDLAPGEIITFKVIRKMGTEAAIAIALTVALALLGLALVMKRVEKRKREKTVMARDL